MGKWTKLNGLLVIGLVATAFVATACGGFDDDSYPPFAPIESGESGEVDPPGKIVEPDTSPDRTSPVGACDIEPLMWSNDSIHRYSAAEFRWTPDRLAIISGRDVFGSGHGAWAARDGATLYETSSRAILDSTASFDRILTQESRDGVETVSVQEWATGTNIWSRDNERIVAATMTEDAGRVATMSCDTWSETSDGNVEVAIHDVATGFVIHTEQIEDRACSWWTSYGPQALAFSPDGRHLAVAVGESIVHSERPQMPPVALLISEDEDGFRSTRHDLPWSPESRGYEAHMASLSFDPSSERFTLVASSGESLEIDTSDGSVVERSTRGAFAANYDTYLPMMPASPVAWTDAGDVEAMIATNGAVELRNRDGESFHRLEAPEVSDLVENGWQDSGRNPVVSIAFAPGDEMFAVAFRRGIGVWGCEGALDGLPDFNELTGVSIQPRWLDEGIEVDVQHFGEPAGFVTGQRLLVDGEPVVTTTLGATMRHYSHESSVVVQVELNDGVKTIRSEPVTMTRPE